jgi:pimeloyl-ACP methyl ester carboxylesterase
MPFVDRPDARIWWDQSGTGDPVLLIMGHAYGAGMWHRTVPGLAASYRVIRFDNRGVGRSSDPPGSYSVQLMADDALAVLDAAGAASAHVYGVSLGGAIALQLTLDHPGRVRSLGCTAASAGGVPRGVLLSRVRSLLPAAALNRMAWKLLYGPGTPAARRAEDQQIVRRTRCSGRGRRGQLSGAAGFDVTGRLAEIRVPVLVMHGARDRIVPAASARRLAGSHRRSPAADIPRRRARLHHRRHPRRQPGSAALPGWPARSSRRCAPGSQHGGGVTLTRAGFVGRVERL